MKEKLKKIVLSSVMLLIVAIIFYLLGAFWELSFDVTIWKERTREIIAAIFILPMVFCVVVTAIIITD